MYRSMQADAFTEVTTTQQYKLGEVRCEETRTNGTRTWRYIRMEGGAIAKGEGVMQENGVSQYRGAISAVTTPNARMLGVAQHAIAENSYGWIGKEGMFELASDGTTTADTIQATAASGRFTDGTAVTSENGAWALETESPAEAGGFFTALIKF